MNIYKKKCTRSTAQKGLNTDTIPFFFNIVLKNFKIFHFVYSDFQILWSYTVPGVNTATKFRIMKIVRYYPCMAVFFLHFAYLRGILSSC